MSTAEPAPSHYPTVTPVSIADLEHALRLLEVLPPDTSVEEAAAIGRLRHGLTAAQQAQQRARDGHPRLSLGDTTLEEPDHDAAELLALPVPVRRATAGETPSAKAARRLELKVGTLRARALAELVQAGPVGLTDVELEERLGVKRPTGGNRRLELVKLGLVEHALDSGLGRPTTNRTRIVAGHGAAYVWRANDRGLAALEALGYRVDRTGIAGRTVTAPMDA